MPMVATGSFTAEQLAFRAGVPLRTVRFYLQERLIDPPLGRGPGPHFTEHHLAQLQQARTLQNAGFALDDIRDRRDQLGLGLHVMAAFDSLRREWQPEPPARVHAPQEDADGDMDAADCTRIPMAAGVELLVSRDLVLPSPRQLVDIALYIRKIFDQR